MRGALARFESIPEETPSKSSKTDYKKMPRSGLLWNGSEQDSLREDGGQTR